MDQENISKINKLHKEITSSLRSTVSYAIEIGYLLNVSKKELNHGDFIPWIEKHCNFSGRAARNYLKIFLYKDKTAQHADLQEAYKAINLIEQRKNEDELNKLNEKIALKIKTGKNPEGWTRADDYEYKKRTDDEAYEKRKQKLFDDKKEEINKKYGIPRDEDSADDFFEKIINDVKARSSEKNKLRDKINMHGSQDPFFDVLDEYLNGLENDSRRMESLHNLIRYCKKLVNKYQIISAK